MARNSGTRHPRTRSLAKVTADIERGKALFMDHPRIKPVNSVDIAKATIANLQKDEKTRSEVKRLAEAALQLWGLPAIARDAQDFWGKSANRAVFKFFSQAYTADLETLGFAFLFDLVRMNEEERRAKIFSPTLALAARLGTEQLVTVVGDEQVLQALDLPGPTGIVIKTHNDPWSVTNPLPTRLADYSDQTLLQYAGTLNPNQELVRGLTVFSPRRPADEW